MPVDAASPALTAADFEFIRELVLADSAIVINPDQEYLVETRLGGLARREGFPNIGGLIAGLRNGNARRLRTRVVEAMTTNETSFFRDFHPFEILKNNILPELIQKRSTTRRLNIWCAACSTGQEPYSLAMLIREQFPALGAGWDVQIHATDIAQEILDRARQGRFSQLEVNRGLPVQYLLKYFTKVGDEWQLKDVIRNAVKYEQMNLTTPWRPMPAFDLVLLRNVLIYFDVAVKRQILGRVRGLLPPHGYLMLGGAETTFNIDDGYERIDFGRYGCYRLRSAQPVPTPAPQRTAFRA